MVQVQKLGAEVQEKDAKARLVQEECLQLQASLTVSSERSDKFQSEVDLKVHQAIAALDAEGWIQGDDAEDILYNLMSGVGSVHV